MTEIDATKGPTVLRLGTRGSKLARAQTKIVADALRLRHPAVIIEDVVIRTEGDLDKSSPLSLIGGRGVFTCALEAGLRAGTIDLAIHSAKDLPTTEPMDLALIAFMEREDPRDVFISRDGGDLDSLPPGPTIGTSSRRREAEVLAVRPDARIVPLRGNVDTRVRKLREGEDGLDGIVLAAAGLLRMGWSEVITSYLPVHQFVPSPGQGALALQIRADDRATAELLTSLNEPAVANAVRVERAFLRAAGGGCTAPIGAYVEPREGAYFLHALVGAEGGRDMAYRGLWLPEDPVAAEAAAAKLAREMMRSLVRSTNVASLGGWRVLVTRSGDQAAELALELERFDAEPVLLPAIRILPPEDLSELDRALDLLLTSQFDWIVFASANAVTSFVARLHAMAIDIEVPRRCAIAAVGEATAEALATNGLPADVIPDSFAANALAAELARRGIAGQRILLPRSQIGRDELVDDLRAAGAHVEPVVAYRTEPVTTMDADLINRLRGNEIDAVTVTSPSCVRGLMGMIGNNPDNLRGVVLAATGETTATAARNAGLDVSTIAAEASAKGLVRALVVYRSTRFQSMTCWDGEVIGATVASHSPRSPGS